MEIDLKKLKESGLFVEEFLYLCLINEGEDVQNYSWASGRSIKVELEMLEMGLWIKSTENGYVLREKSRRLFEPESDDVSEVIEYLNKVAGKKFSTSSPANRKFVKARLLSYTKDDLKRVVDTMVSRWGKDPKMRDYLRPETLFNETKFQTYYNFTTEEPINRIVAR